mmetsp:Transcript_24416/g.35881  ORF Transcript_24416/g.35881 Transcript_24416/m.35881 type:complete len:279 (-) Transcript_24416:134-970(-)|eukprot:CAMPEP_0185031002 /NCGR_PEP_ID=MMETSP1103-20130426/18206_1 /TAXON_ID=36769 /ORGANISM="Paraphysomonas bandaiensis, Strain Caron Lab Isolate" /LENGTH=278 /DNA_ID=CAMNT_0027566345 /DNA_START=90 /DNA_END=926 /DNA_ORIENTATION=-
MIIGKRATRGKRINELVGEDLEKDKAFWEHDVWRDDEDSSGAESYSEEEVKPDVFDSDFNESEDDESSDDEEGELKRAEKRKKVDKRNTYREPVPRATFTKPKAVKPKARRVESAGSADVIAMKLRHSTQSKTAAQESARKEAQSAKPKTTPRPPLPKREFTQKDLLLEALDTEVTNAKWLTSQQIAEEERAKSDRVSKGPATDKTTLLSRRGAYNTVTFAESRWPTIFDKRSCEPPSHKTCVVTGLPAKYVDPQTGCPYHNAEAFKLIRSNCKIKRY